MTPPNTPETPSGESAPRGEPLIRGIQGYKFLVRDDDGEGRWVRLRGAGGCIGDGTTHVKERTPESLRKVYRALLGRARAQLRRIGAVYEHVETPNGPTSFRSLEIRPASIEAVGCVQWPRPEQPTEVLS